MAPADAAAQASGSRKTVGRVVPSRYMQQAASSKPTQKRPAASEPAAAPAKKPRRDEPSMTAAQRRETLAAQLAERRKTLEASRMARLARQIEQEELANKKSRQTARPAKSRPVTPTEPPTSAKVATVSTSSLQGRALPSRRITKAPSEPAKLTSEKVTEPPPTLSQDPSAIPALAKANAASEAKPAEPTLSVPISGPEPLEPPLHTQVRLLQWQFLLERTRELHAREEQAARDQIELVWQHVERLRDAKCDRDVVQTWQRIENQVLPVLEREVAAMQHLVDALPEFEPVHGAIMDGIALTQNTVFCPPGARISNLDHFVTGLEMCLRAVTNIGANVDLERTETLLAQVRDLIQLVHQVTEVEREIADIKTHLRIHEAHATSRRHLAAAKPRWDRPVFESI